MLENQSHIPYYVQIKNYLIKLVAQKKPQDPIPSEAQLAKMFQVSRGTVKQAIMDLVYEGVLYREQGKGTFVAPTKVSRSFDSLPSFTDDIRRMGFEPHTKMISLQFVTPDEKIQSIFQLEPHEQVIKYKRLVSMESTPIVVVSSYLNPHIYPSLTAADMEQSLYQTLQRVYGLVPVKAQDSYTIVDISSQTADLLACKHASSVCYSQRIAYLENNLAAEYVESFIRSDRFKLDVCIGMAPSCFAANPSSSDQQNTTLPYEISLNKVIT